jgi:hypothetical protein
MTRKRASKGETMSNATTETDRTGLSPNEGVFETSDRLRYSFNEAVGKTVQAFDYVTYRGLDSLEVRFTDGTLLAMDISARPALDVSYKKDTDDELETLRDYKVPAFVGGPRWML